MNRIVAYGFANTNRSDIKVEDTLAYKQLEIFHSAEKVVDIHWHSDKREELDKLIEEMDEGDLIYMYSIDTLLKGKNKGVWYYKRIIEKGIELFVLDHNGDLPKISPVSTFQYIPDVGWQMRSMVNGTNKITNNELIDAMVEITGNYKPVSATGKTTYKAYITNAFRELYFMYEAYRITESQLLNLLPIELGMSNKQTFISLCKEYEKSVGYIEDFEKYCEYDEKFLQLPKRTGKLPVEYDNIIAISQNVTKSTDKERIEIALGEMNIWSTPDIILRWKLAKDKIPKPRKHDGRTVEKVFT